MNAADPQGALADLTARLRVIELSARRQADAVLAGRARSRRIGAGTDFEEVRAYAPGDEVRHLDWNATARAAAPMVRRFREERELPLVLVVDVSASGDFGSARARRERIAELAGILAFSAVDVDDPVGLVLFDAEIRAWLPPRRGHAQVTRVLRAILAQPAAGDRTDVAGAIAGAARRLRAPSMIAVLSDLQTPLAPLHDVLVQVGRRHDLYALQVTDPTDAELPDVGHVALEDPETGRVIELDTGRRRVREAYARAAAARAEAIAGHFRAAGVDRVPVSAAEDPVPVLRRFFARRAA